MSSRLELPEENSVHNLFPGPILVLAGPGTGKTHSLARRVKWLVEEKGVNPEEITVITFTNEAATNMRHRLGDDEKTDVFMQADQQPKQISTMHSLGQKIIADNLDSLGLSEDPNLILSDKLRRLLFEDAAQLAGFKRLKGQKAMLIKQKGIELDEQDEIDKIIKTYNEILRSCNYIDFDDQIILACKLLADNPSLLCFYQDRAKHLLVDEYQDINHRQFELIRLLSAENPEGLFVVGDDDQSIYGFRGGSPEFIRSFREHFGDNARVCNISHCRRCPPKILKAALSMVEKFNPDRLQKDQPTFSSTIQDSVKIINSPTQEKEAEIISKMCSEVSSFNEVLILVPHLTFAKPIINSLRRRRVGHDCRATIDEKGLVLLDTLGSWLANPSESFSLRQVLEFLLEAPELGVPSSRVKKQTKLELREKLVFDISSLWIGVTEENLSLYESLKSDSNQSDLLSNLLKDLDKLLRMNDAPSDNYLEVLGTTFKPWKVPSAMFQEVSTWVDEVMGRYSTGLSNVRIMSMRLAKGLEADYVFIVGLDEQVFPRPNLGPDELEEDSRLLFVSMTRAKKGLYLCHSRKRSSSITHSKDSYGLKQSRFIDVIPKELKRPVFIPAASVRKRMKQ